MKVAYAEREDAANLCTVCTKNHSLNSNLLCNDVSTIIIVQYIF